MSSDLLFSGGALEAALTIKTSPRARVMRLRVDPRTGDVLLTIPRRVSRRKAIEWAAGHRPWIEEALSKVPAAMSIMPGSTIPYLGEPHLVDWREDRPRIVRVEPGRLIVGGPREALEARLLRWLKTRARDLLSYETREYATKAGVTVARVGVGDPLSRWGSCSASGAIRYSWRLILAPDWVRRATVAHEVAHRVHMNHGPFFHALVAELLECDPRPAGEWLKREGASLHRIGRR